MSEYHNPKNAPPELTFLGRTVGIILWIGVFALLVFFVAIVVVLERSGIVRPPIADQERIPSLVSR
jgi:hypothetical protein